MSESIAKAQLEELKGRYHSKEMIDLPEFDGHRRLIDSAIFSSNGAPDKIAAIAETQGQQVAFAVTQTIREPDRLEKIITPIVLAAITEAIKEHADNCGVKQFPVADDSNILITLPIIGPILSSHGKAATVMAGKLALFAIIISLMFGYGYWQNSSFRKAVTAELDRAMEQRSRSDQQAVSRTEAVRAEIQDVKTAVQEK